MLEKVNTAGYVSLKQLSVDKVRSQALQWFNKLYPQNNRDSSPAPEQPSREVAFVS